MGCFSSSNTPTPDAGANFFDASLPETTLHDVGTRETATVVEAGFDAPLEASPQPLPVVVTVVGAAGPEQGITIVYGDSTGAVTGTATTGATGQASQVVPDGSMLTALLGDPLNSRPFTFMGVEAGDSLVVVDWLLPSDLATTVTALPANPPMGATSYSLMGGSCSTGFEGASATLSLIQGTSAPCVGIGQTSNGLGAAFPLLVDAYDEGGNPLGFTFQKDNALASANDAGVVEATLGGTWSTALTTQSLATINGADGGANTQSILAEVANGVMLPLSNQGATTPQFTTHAGYADFIQSEVNAGNYKSAVAVATRMPPPTVNGTLTVDISSLDTMPAINDASATMNTPGQPTVTWSTNSGSLASTTGIVTMTTWEAPLDGGTYQYGTWTIVSPSTLTSQQAPALPAGSSAWAPQAGASFENVVVYGAQGAALPTYAQIRAAATLFPAQYGCIAWPISPPLPVAGTLTVTVVTTGGCG